ncbi:uncharacterized protein PV07_01316 [Cladophialophora immunda]|uniref:Uncharacterized protein n=1 Tax=Cladophialophora immunda TaxID=569365 RepID=A0A0D2DFT9_9EURO|nr:uncharacterized protein PV07_01316 [Cladophialophora immunda]KIW34539.1 hypothetical protein PV07_01316 [Cladophialophora immunda]
MGYRLVDIPSTDTRHSKEHASAVLQSGRGFLQSVNDYAKVVLRSLGLAIAGSLGGWRGSEGPKIALRKSRGIAAARASVHLIPLVACGVVLGYNFRIVFVEYNAAYSALQFVAKLHEMLMQASIAAIVLAYIRQGLIGNTALPFGALLAASQVQNTSTIFSLEFWGAVTSPSLSLRRKFELFTFVLVSLVMAASVGPSSAILMLPRGMQPRVGSLDVYLNETVFFPSQLTAASASGIANLAAAEQIFYRDLIETPWITAEWFDDIQVNITYTVSTGQDVGGYTVCSPSLAAVYIDNTSEDNPAWKHLDKRLSNATGWFSSYLSKQACVKVFCGVQEVSGDHNSSYLQLRGSQSSSDSQQASGLPANLNLTEGAFLDSYNGTTDPHLMWLRTPESLRSNYSIIAVYAPSRPEDSGTTAITCGAQAAWLSSHVKTSDYYSGTTYINGDVPSEVREGDPITNTGGDPYSESWSEPTVPISVEWANISTSPQTTNDGPDLTSIVTTQDLFYRLDMLSSSDDSGCGSPSPDDCASPYVDTLPYLTALLGTMIATAMSVHNASAPLSLGGSEQTAGFTRVRLDFFGIGTGYCIDTFPDVIAACVLGLYCACALGHLVWSICSGLSSNSWDSVAELVALALNSKRPAQLRYTSAGVETIGVFREPIRILENETQSLEMVFENDADLKGTHKRLKRNQEY